MRKVKTAGLLDIRRINAPSTVQWEEGNLTYDNSASTAPLGSIIATVNVEKWMDQTFVTVDVTSLVRDWLNGTFNNGIALAPVASAVLCNGE